MPTSSKVKKKIEGALPKQVKGKIYELGCGWGGIASLLASRYPHCEVLAFEVSPIPWLYTAIVKRLSRLPNMTLFWKDFFQESLGDADLIVCYLYPGAMERLKRKFDQELKPGTVVISNSFAIPGWEPQEVLQVGDFYRTKVYVYKKG